MSGWIIGENVPWTVSWTSEEAFSLRPSTEFPGYTDLVQVQKPGEGTPKFKALNVTRQRLGMTQHLCHVCGRRTLRHDRYIFPIESGGFVTVPDETRRYVGTVAPVHRACGRHAATLCPHLSAAYAEPVAFPSEDSLVVPRPGIPEGMEPLAATLPRNLKIVFSCFRLYGPRFTRTVERLRRERGDPAVIDTLAPKTSAMLPPDGQTRTRA